LAQASELPLSVANMKQAGMLRMEMHRSFQDAQLHMPMLSSLHQYFFDEFGMPTM
jgi:hypothetical protein